MNVLRPYLIWISRLFVGMIFIYSGFVKGVDPLGSAYKFVDYFHAFGAFWADDLALTLSIIQSMLEFCIGFAVLLNLNPKQSSFAALLFMAFYTPLTLILAFTNPVHDCGCFGDALILTNWQTFWKNIILAIPVLYLFVIRKKHDVKLSCSEQWTAIGISAVFMLMISWYGIKHLPILDFRPYKIGNYLPAGMVIPEDAEADVWESNFIYSKEGISQEFSIKNLPDSSWTFVEAKHKLIKKGYVPPIHDFSITDSDGNDLTDQILSSSNYNFFIISYNLEKTNTSYMSKINQLVEFAENNGFPVYGLTASNQDMIQSFKEKTNATYNFYSTDETTLKTMIRANPGIMLIKDGTVLNLWNSRDIPDKEELNENLLHHSVSFYKKQADKYYIYTLILLTGLLIAIYMIFRSNFLNKNKL